MKETYDLFVIGGGSAGVRAARVAASLGARVGLAECDRLGGTCVIRGCVPKKLFVYASRVPEELRRARAFGWNIAAATFSWATFKQRRDQEIARLEGVYGTILAKAGVKVFPELAALAGDGSVALSSGEVVHARHILIAAGGQPKVPEFPGASLAAVSDDMFELAEQPHHAVVLGGGYIALEFACILHELGTQTTLAYRGPQVLRGFDGDIRDAIRRILGARGLEIRVNATPERIEARADGCRRVHFTDGSQIDCDCVLAATGRAPAIARLNLCEAGVETDAAGAIRVDALGRTTAEGVYAAGDVTNAVNLTPVALRQGELLARRLFGAENARFDTRILPSAVFTSPEIGVCGETEQEATALRPVSVYATTVSSLSSTLVRSVSGDRSDGGYEPGYIKLIVDKTTDAIVGCHIIGDQAAEMIQLVGVAMQAGAKKADFDRTIAVHPTFAEEIVTLR